MKRNQDFERYGHKCQYLSICLGCLVMMLMLSFTGTLCAQQAVPEKEYRKMIERLDVDDCVKELPKNSPGQFWATMIENNEELNKFYREIRKNKGAEKEAIERMSQFPRLCVIDDETIVRSMQAFCDSLLVDTGIASLGVYCTLHVIDSDEINAYTVPSTNGFALCLTSGMVNHPQITREILMGFVAHEFVHASLRHQIRHLYAHGKKRRKNELWGGILGGIAGVALGVGGAAIGMSAGALAYDTAMLADNIAANSTVRHSYSYSRNQEYEADLIAFRFLQNLGLEGEYINGLRIIEDEYDQLYTAYSDHPTIDMRVEFLKFALLNPDISNTRNNRLRMLEQQRALRQQEEAAE